MEMKYYKRDNTVMVCNFNAANYTIELDQDYVEGWTLFLRDGGKGYPIEIGRLISTDKYNAFCCYKFNYGNEACEDKIGSIYRKNWSLVGTKIYKTEKIQYVDPSVLTDAERSLLDSGNAFFTDYDCEPVPKESPEPTHIKELASHISIIYPYDYGVSAIFKSTFNDNYILVMEQPHHGPECRTVGWHKLKELGLTDAQIELL
jgi:hypothetical protein